MKKRERVLVTEQPADERVLTAHAVAARAGETAARDGAERPPSGVVAVGTGDEGFRARAVAASETLGRWIDYACRAILVASVVLSCLLVFASVVSRAVSGSSIVWVDDATQIAMATAAFVGCVTAFHHGEHVGLHSLAAKYLTEPVRAQVSAGSTAAILAFATVVGAEASTLSTAAGLGTFGSLQWPTHLLYMPLAAGSILLAVLAALRIFQDIVVRRLWVGPLVVAAISAVLYLCAPALEDAGQQTPLWAAAVVIIMMMLLGTPVAFAIGIGAVVGVVLGPGLTLDNIPLQMTNLVTNITLISLPFFVLAGALLSRGDVAVRLLDVVRRLSKNSRASEGIAAVVSMYLFSGLSGSKFADIASVAPGLATASMSDPSNDDAPGPKEEMAGILGASAVMGETVPPSLTMLVLGSVTTISTAALFIGGLAPAALMGIGIIITAWLRSRRLPRPAELQSRRLIFAILAAVPAAVGIAIIAGGIIGGFATPSEASSLAVVYAAVLIGVFYRIGWRGLLDAVELAARMAGMLLFLISITGALAWFLTVSGIADDMTSLAQALGDDKALFILVSVVMLIVLGSIFEGLPAILIFAPVLVPIATKLGVDELQYGIVLLMAMGVGTFLPPFGVGYYATCAIVGVRPERTVRVTLIYLVPIVLGVVVLAVVPQITTGLVVALNVK